MSDTAEFFLTSPHNWNRVPGSAIDKVLDEVVSRLESIRDPKSGEVAQVTRTPVEDGVKIEVRGSEYICSEARRRMSMLEDS